MKRGPVKRKADGWVECGRVGRARSRECGGLPRRTRFTRFARARSCRRSHATNAARLQELYELQQLTLGAALAQIHVSRSLEPSCLSESSGQHTAREDDYGYVDASSDDQVGIAGAVGAVPGRGGLQRLASNMALVHTPLAPSQQQVVSLPPLVRGHRARNSCHHVCAFAGPRPPRELPGAAPPGSRCSGHSGR